MNRVDPQAMPAPPSLMKSLKAGFDAISNQILLIVFPLALDLLLWLGPHFSLRQLVLTLLAQAEETAETAEVTAPIRETMVLMAERFNLLSALRTFPVGVSSLMASRSPVEVPLGQPATWEMASVSTVFGVWLLITAAGLILGALYFSGVSQAAVWGSVRWPDAFKRWPRVSLRTAGLALLWFAVIFIMSMPFFCVMPFVMMMGFAAAFSFLVIYSLLMALTLFPLIFSPHGVFLYDLDIWTSVRWGIGLVRKTYPISFFLVAAAVGIATVLNLFWNVPPENSWMMLVGITGHAFVTTGLLAATFVYYHDADRWVKSQLRAEKA